MTLWFVFALMTAAAIFAVLWPLGRGTKRQNDGRETVVYKDQLAEIGPALGTVAVVSDRIAIGPDRVIVSAKSCQYRRQHAPAAAIGWIFLQVLLDLCHQIV